MRPVPGFEGGQAVFFCEKAKIGPESENGRESYANRESDIVHTELYFYGFKGIK